MATTRYRPPQPTNRSTCLPTGLSLNSPTRGKGENWKRAVLFLQCLEMSSQNKRGGLWVHVLPREEHPRPKRGAPRRQPQRQSNPKKGRGFSCMARGLALSTARRAAWPGRSSWTAHLSSADFFRFRAGPTTPALAHIFSHLLPSLSSSECIGSRFTSPFYHPLTATPHGQSPMPI